MKLIKNLFLTIITAFLLLVSGSEVFSQTLTSSPYSRFGIGDIFLKGFGRNKAMGNTGLALRNPYHLNNLNPASYSSMDSSCFIYEFGVMGRETKYISSDQKFDNTNANINFVSVGFPVSKFWFTSIGLVPFSNYGFNTQTDITEPNIGKVENIYSGSGGINQFYFGNSVKLTGKLSIGVNASYLFGTIDRSNTTSFPDDNKSYALSSKKEMKISDFYFNYGLQYSDSIAHKTNFIIGLVFDNKTKIHTSNTELTTSFLPSNYSATLDTLTDTTRNSHFLFPYNAGLGISISRNNKFTFSMDYIMQNWANSKFYEEIDTLVNSNYIGFGMEYIPDINSVSHYRNRIAYRIGGHYSNSYIKIKGTPVNDYGLSFGFGFPLRKSKTTFNISFELGSRGTTKNNLIKENYGIITFNLTFFDSWFIRKRFE
jgi:hypothetical protein